MASGVILPHREVPFSAANFHALRVGAPLRTVKETQSLVLLEQGGVAEQTQRENARAAATTPSDSGSGSRSGSPSSSSPPSWS
jgi:hypothetical protein